MLLFLIAVMAAPPNCVGRKAVKKETGWLCPDGKVGFGHDDLSTHWMLQCHRRGAYVKGEPSDLSAWKCQTASRPDTTLVRCEGARLEGGRHATSTQVAGILLPPGQTQRWRCSNTLTWQIGGEIGTDAQNTGECPAPATVMMHTAPGHRVVWCVDSAGQPTTLKSLRSLGRWIKGRFVDGKPTETWTSAQAGRYRDAKATDPTILYNPARAAAFFKNPPAKKSRRRSPFDLKGGLIAGAWATSAILLERNLAPDDNHFAPVSGVLFGTTVGAGLGILSEASSYRRGGSPTFLVVGAIAGAVGGYFLGDAARGRPLLYYGMQIPLTALIWAIF